jgi:WD40 repeat protein
MKVLAVLVGLTLSLTAAILPTTVIKTDALISDMVVNEGKIYAATDGEGVNVFDSKNFKKLGVIRVPDIKNSEGKFFSPKVYSVDHYQNATVTVTESGGDFRNVYLIREGKAVKIIDNGRGLLIKKARFLDLDHLLFGLSGDTIVLFDIAKNTLIYQVQAGGGMFRDMVLSPSKSLVAVADEGGEITMLNVKNGHLVKTLRGINVDNINRIDYKQNTILSAGQDRRVGVYRSGGSYYLETDFFVYAVGLSPSASRGVYTDGTENELQVFDTTTKAKITRLQSGEVILDTLIFLDEHRLIGAGEENKIYYWRLP